MTAVVIEWLAATGRSGASSLANCFVAGQGNKVSLADVKIATGKQAKQGPAGLFSGEERVERLYL